MTSITDWTGFGEVTVVGHTIDSSTLGYLTTGLSWLKRNTLMTDINRGTKGIRSTRLLSRTGLAGITASITDTALSSQITVISHLTLGIITTFTSLVIIIKLTG